MNIRGIYARTVLALIRPALDLERSQCATTTRVEHIIQSVISQERRPGGLLHEQRRPEKK